MRRKRIGKRTVAFSVVAAILMGTLAPCADAFAQGEEEEKQLAQELLQMEEEYPQGAFAFENPQITLAEGEKTEIVLLRKGNRESEAKISLRAVDVSALYSRDYTLTVKEGTFLSRTLEGGSDKTLTDSFIETQKKENAETPKNDEIPQEDSELSGGENAAEDALQQEESPVEETLEEESPVELEAGESNLNQEEDVNKEFRALEGQSGLQAARDAQLGQQTERVDWREAAPDSEEYGKIQEMTSAGGKQVEEFAKGIDGVRYDFTFKPGEYKKVITIETMEDTVSESDEQVLLTLFEAENAELADTQTAYINITDNDVKEESVFAVAQTDIYVER